MSVNKVTDVLGYQVLKSGTAVGANYREANRAESRKDFIHKIGIDEKEASETQYWLELLEESEIGPAPERQWLLRESGEFMAIFTSIGKTAKSNMPNSPFKGSKVKNRKSNFDVRNPKTEIST